MMAIPFRADHLRVLRTQAAQTVELSLISPDIAYRMELQTDAWSILDADTPLFCGGIIETGKNGMLWAFVSGDAGRRLWTITRMCSRYLNLKTNLQRIETSVRADFGPGCRWAKILGFECEGLMRKYGVEGSDHLRYARVL